MQGGLEEILIFSKIAIAFRQYEKAKYCISINFNNDGVTDEDRKKLSELTGYINKSIGRERAVNMLALPNVKMEQIMGETGLSEVEIMELQRKLAVEKTPKKPTSYDDIEGH